MARRAVVFGGAGFIGFHLMRELAARGDFEAIVSADIAAPTWRVDGVAYETCDVRQAIPDALCPGATDIYNLAAVHQTPGHPYHAYYETNVFGALNICEFARRTQAPRITFTSTMSVYGPSESPKTEASTPEPIAAYGWSKWMGERIHQTWRAETPGRRLMIVRPAVIYGRGERGNLTRLAAALKKRAFVYPGRKDTTKACGYVGELVRAMVFADDLGREEFLFNFAYPVAPTIEDICTAYHEVGGLPKPLGVLPLPVMKAAALPFEALNAIGVRNPINRERLLKLVRSTFIVPQALLDAGYAFETDLPESLRRWRADSPSGFYE